MLHKALFKATSALLSSSLIVTSGYAAFALENTIFQLSENTQETTETPTESDNPSGETPEAPVTSSINISVNCFSTENNTYDLVVSSLDYLENLKDFNFKITVSDAEISNPEFGAELKTGAYIVEKVGSNSVNFKNGSAEKLLSGKLALCSMNVTALPTSESISFSDFTAVKEDGTVVTYTPVISIKEGPVVPTLSEKEQAVYDAISALPSLSSLSFYANSTLVSPETLKESVSAVVSSYNSLSSTEKSNVNEVLTYNMKGSEILTTLPPVINAMCNVFDVFILSEKLKGIEDTELVNYKFIIDVYDSIKGDISADGLANPSALYTEYEAALQLITSSAEKITAALAAMDYSEKIDNTARQLETAKPSTTDKYYDKYLSCLLTYANNLYKDMEANCTDKYVDYMLRDLDTKISAIEAMQNNIASLPQFEVGKVMRARNYSINITRTYTADTDADINISIYAEDDPDTVIDSKSATFKASEKTLKASLTATKKVYPADGKNIIVSITYKLDGITYNLGSQTVKCYKEQVNTSSSTMGAANSSSSSSSNDTPSSSTGTVYPDIDDDDDDNNDKNSSVSSDTELFSDIGNYSWASEAIEGLYYAGIINGMEEGIFNPAGNVTREQFCKMVVQLFNVLDYEESIDTFIDVDPNGWYYPYICSSVKSGYVQGQSSEYFGIGESIMRQDMATILYRALGSQGKSTVLSFTDNEKIADYAKEAIAEFVGLGIINGYEDGSFKPRGTATRAEAAKVIWGVYQLLN